MQQLIIIATAAALAALFVSQATAVISSTSHEHAATPAPWPQQNATCSDVIEQRYPRQYVAFKTTTPPTIDGKLDEPMWQERGFTEDFVDISTQTLPHFRTRAKIAWDDEWLYVGGYVEDTAVWANITYTCHCYNQSEDQVIFHDNDFEVFVDPSGTCWDYKEYEMNAANQNWDLILNKPYENNGYENSTRVFGKNGFDMVPPLKSGVYIDGKLNDPASKPKFWSVEIAFPLSKLTERTNVSYPPSDGDYWRINFSRVEWAVKIINGKYEKFPSCQSCPYPGTNNCDNWVWSPMYAIDVHHPELWAFLQFSTAAVNQTAPIRNREWPARYVAHELYYANAMYQNQFGNYTDDLAMLVPAANFPAVLSGNCTGTPRIVLGDEGQTYTAYIPEQAEHPKFTVSITNERYIQAHYHDSASSP
jgi:hypothetical protein